MRRSLVALMTAAAVAVAGLAGGPARADVRAEPGLRATLQRDADALLRYGIPGVLVELDTPRAADVRVRSGYGDVARRTPVPWNARFRIGSYTKTFVSATVLQLVGEGRMSLDDTVERWLPGLVRGNGNDGRAVTVRQLLQHQSGLPDYVAELDFLFSEEGFLQNRFRTLTPEEAVALALRSEREFAPGTSWNYSNTNYMLAGMVVERVTGNPWGDEVRDRILRPLGLRHTYSPGTTPTIARPHAVAYERFPGPDATEDDPDYGDPVDVTAQNPSWGGAAGDMISTTDDANRFLQALLSGRVLRPAQLAEMLRTVPTNDRFRENWPGVRYGLGIMWVPNPCGGFFTHGGDIPGFMTRNGATPDGARSVVVSVNTDSPWPEPGVPEPARDLTTDLVNHALCGVR
jgi:D-alanyl-D-alanine carboxypeptidase